MASNHLYPGTQTRLASKINNTVAHMQSVVSELSEINAILAQIALDGAEALATETGHASADDASAEQALLASVAAELAACPFFQQTLARRG
jgi:hypothetical protein